jgi:DNA-binding transcriptional ArsR family regulator
MRTTVSFAKALADPTRQEIMDLLCCRWLNVSDIVDQLDVSQPTVSHHLGILKAAGLVDSRREGKQIFYTLNQTVLADRCCRLVEQFAPEHEIRVTMAADEG